MASIDERDGVWSVRWREGGRQKRISCSTERRAHALAEEIDDQLERTGRYEPRRLGQSTDLDLIVRDYIGDVVRKRRPNTARRYAQMLQMWLNWTGRALAHDVLTFVRLSEYHAHLSSPATGRHLHGRSAETIRKHIEAIELVWRWAWQRQARGDYHGVPQPDSLELERQAAPHKLAPSWEQMDACIAAATGWQRDLYVLLRCTGLRVQQAMELQWADVRIDGPVPSLHVRPELGKSKQERRGRFVPIAPVLVAELAGWGRREGYVLRCGRDKRVARARDADRAWARAAVDRSIWKGCGHHAFRAGFVSGLKLLGADTEAVEHLVGHSRGSVRERYASPESLPMVVAVGLVPPIALGTPWAHLPVERTLEEHRAGGTNRK